MFSHKNGENDCSSRGRARKKPPKWLKTRYQQKTGAAPPSAVRKTPKSKKTVKISQIKALHRVVQSEKHPQSI